MLPSLLQVHINTSLGTGGETVDGFSSVPQHRRAHTRQSTACRTSQGADTPHHAMQCLSFPFIIISLLLSFTNANRLNRLFSFVLYFPSSPHFLCPLPWTAQLTG